MGSLRPAGRDRSRFPESIFERSFLERLLARSPDLFQLRRLARQPAGQCLRVRRQQYGREAFARAAGPFHLARAGSKRSAMRGSGSPIELPLWGSVQSAPQGSVSSCNCLSIGAQERIGRYPDHIPAISDTCDHLNRHTAYFVPPVWISSFHSGQPPTFFRIFFSMRSILLKSGKKMPAF